jgi:threonyl-tRNA synthetase
VPYMLVVGGREQENQQVSVRNRKHGDLGVKSVPEFLADIGRLIESKAISE